MYEQGVDGLFESDVEAAAEFYRLAGAIFSLYAYVRA
jgi:hypothetical protein